MEHTDRASHMGSPKHSLRVPCRAMTTCWPLSKTAVTFLVRMLGRMPCQRPCIRLVQRLVHLQGRLAVNMHLPICLLYTSPSPRD
eukprot:3307554-Alexandrium_andersonii.AAC.1